MNQKRSKISAGRTKTLYNHHEEDKAVLSFEDGIRSWDGPVQKTISGKGILNNRISAHMMTCLESIGLPTHFLKSLNMREQEIRKVEPMDIVFRVRNIAAGTLAARLGLDEGTVLPRPIIEFHYKKKPGHYELIGEDHAVAFQWIDPIELEEAVTIAYRANDYMNGLMTAVGLRLVDFQLEIGRLYGEYGELYLMIADELSPDTMRLWDIKTNRAFEPTIQSYQEVAARLGVIPREDFSEQKAKDWDTIENILANDTTRKIRPITKLTPRQKTTR